MQVKPTCNNVISVKSYMLDSRTSIVLVKFFNLRLAKSYRRFQNGHFDCFTLIGNHNEFQGRKGSCDIDVINGPKSME